MEVLSLNCRILIGIYTNWNVLSIVGFKTNVLLLLILYWLILFLYLFWSFLDLIINIVLLMFYHCGIH